MDLSDRELFYLIARESAPTILAEAERAVKLAQLPAPEDLQDFVDDGECYECAAGITKAFPHLTWQAGAYVGDDGRLRDHAWVSSPDGTIIDSTHGQFDPKIPILYAEPGSPEHQRYIRAEDMSEEQRHHTYGDESGIKPGEPGYSGKWAATVEDSEPANNFGFLKEPHEKLYPCAWIGLRMRDEAKTAILGHINDALADNGYPDAGRFINYSVYGSGASYNWDEDGDFDMQMWVDTDKFNEGKDEPMTEDDLVADIRRIVQLVNFPSFKELGLANEESDGTMLVQYYAKPGTGSKEENLASKPYACFDLEKEVWYQKPEPITPEFYGEWFILLEPKAKDIAMQASAVLESLERNIVEWSFWSQMYENHSDLRFKQKADQAREDAEQDKEGAHNLFLNIFRGRMDAYSPEGEGNKDERDLLEKLLEVWGVFQRLRHAVKEALPWEEQELPEEPLPVEPEGEDVGDEQEEGKKSNHWHIVAAEPKKVAECVHEILRNGGGTFNLDLTPSTLHDGYYSSVAGYEQQVSTEDFGESTLKAYLDAVTGHPDYLLGAWINDGIVYLDLTKHIPDRSAAIEFGIYNDQQAIWDIARNEAVELDPGDFTPQPAFAKVAAWKDLMEKAKRIKDQGRVHILNNEADHVVGRVEGDHGTYTTQIWRQDPNSRAITMWDCECPWDQYAWQRTRQWKKYEGRPCSHVLALQWQAQQQQAQQPQVAPEQLPLPGMAPAPTAPPPVPYAPGPPNLEGQGLPRPGQEPVLPRGPWEPTPQPSDMPPPGTPPVAPGGVPVPQVAPGMQIDPRVLRNAPGQIDPRFTPPAMPGGNSKPTEPGQGGDFGFPGAFSHWHFRSSFENGTIVRAEMPLVGLDREGRQWRVPKNSKGEVLSSDEDKTIAIFPLSTGPLEPHLVRVVADTISFSQSHGSPFIGT
jgi:hypothetical protein